MLLSSTIYDFANAENGIYITLILLQNCNDLANEKTSISGYILNQLVKKYHPVMRLLPVSGLSGALVSAHQIIDKAHRQINNTLTHTLHRAS